MILCILQARTTSSRLPGKVLKPLLGRPMILRQVERVERSRLIDKLLVATSADQSDDQLAKICLSDNVDVYRGSLNDVLDRYYQAALPYKPEQIVRLTGDCPMMDPGLIDQVIRYHLDGGYDYSSNTIEPTFPDGLDIEVFHYKCLEKAWIEAELPSEREHVTPFIINRPEIFSLGNFKNREDLSALRWTVDEQLDYELVQTIFEELYSLNPEFTAADILSFVNSRPGLKVMNTCYERNEGLQKSLEEDLNFRKGK